MRGCGQDAVADALVLYIIIVMDERVDAAPLVVAQVVDDEQEGALLVVQLREELLFQDGVRLQRLVVGAPVDPVEVVALHELGELDVRLLLLCGQHFRNALVFNLFDLQLPVDQIFIKVGPLLHAQTVGDAHGEFAERLLIVGGHLRAHQLLVVDVFLQTKQYLVGIHGFDEVVCNVGADGILHDVLLLALGDHHDGKVRVVFLKPLQRLQSAQSGHVFVEEDDVHKLLLEDFQRFHSAHCGNYIVTF